MSKRFAKKLPNLVLRERDRVVSQPIKFMQSSLEHKSAGEAANSMTPAPQPLPDPEPPIRSELEFDSPVAIRVPFDWTAEQDLACYVQEFGEDKSDAHRYEYVLGEIERHQNLLTERLDAAVRLLWQRPYSLDEVNLGRVSVLGKIKLLRKLLIEHSQHIPCRHRLNYLARFDEDLTRCEQVEELRNKVLERYLLNPKEIWLSHLLQLNDWVGGAWATFDESMNCEHEKSGSVNCLPAPEEPQAVAGTRKLHEGAGQEKPGD